jgi:hypothetical protein
MVVKEYAKLYAPERKWGKECEVFVPEMTRLAMDAIKGNIDVEKKKHKKFVLFKRK